MSALKDFIFPTTLQRWNIQNLDYNWYFMFAIFGGFVGLDYLYIGSPVTAGIKFLVNLFTFGFWWYYDIINAAVAQDQVRLYGPSVPVFGAGGVAGGRFRDPKTPEGDPDLLKRHMNFLIYGIALGIGGIVGLEYFITGDLFSGFMNLLCTITFIGIPISAVWWVYKVYRYAFNTNVCIDMYSEYFGASSGMENACPSIFMSITIWLLKTVQGIVQMVPGIGGILGMILDRLIKSLEAAYGFVKKEIPKIVKVVAVGRPVPTDMAPAPAKIGGGDLTIDGGGSDLNIDSGLLGPFFALTIGLIVVSSIVLSLRRLRQNGPEGKTAAATTTVKQPGDQKSDDPPQPGDPGVPA
jgi:hypothetical protein